MNWFFEPIGNFFSWSFKGYEWLMNHHFNTILIVIGIVMIVWWMIQMTRHPKEN